MLSISQGSIESKEGEPEDTFPGPRYRNNIRSGVGRKVKVNVTHVFRVSTRRSRLISIH
jgi:hypothetical protein